jgi:hypothetical protein
VVAVSTNLLAVSLSTLLIEQPTTAYFPVSATASFLPKFNGNPIRATDILNAQLYDNFYVALANLTSNTSLPPWLDHNNFYLPFSLDATQNPESLVEWERFRIIKAQQPALALTLIVQVWNQEQRLMDFSSSPIKAELRLSFRHIIVSPMAPLSLVS